MYTSKNKLNYSSTITQSGTVFFSPCEQRFCFYRSRQIRSKSSHIFLLGAVLLCCEGGNNYSAAFVIAFIMKLKHIQYDDAKTFVRERRRVVRLSQTMKDNLLQYEDILFPELIVEKPKTAPPVAAASYDSDSDNED